MFFYTTAKRVVPQRYIVTLHTPNFYYRKFAGQPMISEDQAGVSAVEGFVSQAGRDPSELLRCMAEQVYMGFQHLGCRAASWDTAGQGSCSVSDFVDMNELLQWV